MIEAAVAANTGIGLIVGLGNPGSRYAMTRHNAGFWFVDAMAQGKAFKDESKFTGQSLRFQFEGAQCWLFKPLAFMNRSGLPVKLITDYHKIPMGQVLVVHDEIDLPPGAVKLKRGGGHGGHNGLKDLFAHVGQDFWRLRLGVGHPGNRDLVIDYVLDKPQKDDVDAIITAMQRAFTVIPQLLAGEYEKAMHELHTQEQPEA